MGGGGLMMGFGGRFGLGIACINWYISVCNYLL